MGTRIRKKGWWTAGDRRDTYYKCPYKTACIGGITSLVNGTRYTEKAGAMWASRVLLRYCKEVLFVGRALLRPKRQAESQAIIAVVFGMLLWGISCCIVPRKYEDSKVIERGRTFLENKSAEGSLISNN